METFWQDTRYALRMLAKRPVFAVVAVLTLALGIGATTAIFSVVYGVLLQPLPYPEPEQIVGVWQIGPHGNRMQTSDPNFTDWRNESRSFQALAQYTSSVTSIVGGSEPVRLLAAPVSADFFRALGVQPALGRTFLPEEQQLGAAPAVVVSHGYWQRYLGGETNLAGKTLTFWNRTHAVVGVMPPGFSFPPGAEVWTPRELDAPLPSRTAHNWRVIGRLKDGASVEAAKAEMSAMGRRMKQQHGDGIWLVDVEVVPLSEQLVGSVRQPLLVLLGATGFLLLVACANVTNLLLAQATARRKELAVRAALGAGRGRLLRQFLTESLLLSLAGGALGVLLAVGSVRALLALEPGNLPRVEEVGVHWPVLAFAFAVVVATAVALGLLAALRATRVNLQDSLRESERGQAGGAASQRLRGALVVSQVALTLVLLAGAGLLGRSFLRLLEQDTGFRTDSLVTMSVARPFPTDAAAAAQLGRFLEELEARLRAIPGVNEVGGVNTFPLSGGGADGMFLILNRPDEVQSFEDFRRLMDVKERIGYADFRIASPGYFRAMGIPLVRGRLFEERDGPDAPHVAVISESLARTRWPGEDPLGKLIQFGNMDGDVRPYTIVGVVGDVRQRGVDAEPRPTFYGNARQRTRAIANFTVALQATGPAASLIPAARDVVRRLDPAVPPRFRTIEEVVATSLADRRFHLLLLGVFAGAALLLAALGVYGVTSYAVAQRTREIGIRMALGAEPGSVLRLLLSQGLRLVALGVGLGLAGALALTGLVRALLYGVTPTDPLTFAAVALLLLGVALAACWLPARGATRVDPMVVLRYE